MGDENGRLSEAELAELASFADGSLAPADRARVGARVAGSPELQALVEEQRTALAAVEKLDTPAPAGLGARLERDLATPPAPRRRWPSLALVGGVAAGLAAAALVVVLVAGSGAPTIGEVAELAQRDPASPAPAADAADPKLLAASVDGVAFPNYSETFGWKSSGERTDELDGRATRTVYYQRGGREIAYSIVPGEALEWPDGAQRTTREGVELRSFESGDSTVVTWLRDGRTCVLSGPGVAREELLELAAWMGEGSVSF